MNTFIWQRKGKMTNISYNMQEICTRYKAQNRQIVLSFLAAKILSNSITILTPNYKKNLTTILDMTVTNDMF